MTHSNNTLLLLKEEAEFPLFVSCFFFLLFIYIIYFSEHFSSEIPRETSNLEKKPLFWVLGEISSPTPAPCSALVDVALLPPKTPTDFGGDEKKRGSSSISGAAKGRGQASLFEAEGGCGRVGQWSNGLVVQTGVSEESRNWGLRSLHWPGCLSGPPRTACGAAGRSNSDRGSSCSAVSSFCGGWAPLPLGVSGIAAGSERDMRLERRRKGVKAQICWFSGQTPLCDPQRDQPVLRAEVVLLLLLAATPLALVIQWCSSAGKLSDPAGSLDAPRGSLRGGETAQHTSASVNPAATPPTSSAAQRQELFALLIPADAIGTWVCDGLRRF